MRRGCEFYTQRIPTTTAISCGRTRGNLVSAPPRNGCKKREPLIGVLQGKSPLFLKAAIKELSDKAPLRNPHAKAPSTVSQTMDGAHAILPHPSLSQQHLRAATHPLVALLQQRPAAILPTKGERSKARRVPCNRQPPQAAES